MNALLIDPETQTVTAVELDASDFLNGVHQMIGALQLDSLICGSNLALWFDTFGLLEPEQCYWQFHPAAPRIAGRAIVTAVSPEGFPTDVPETAPMETLEASLDWCEDEELLGIDEFIEPVQTEFGLWPRIVQQPRRRCEKTLH
jgi:hypothetical protein